MDVKNDSNDSNNRSTSASSLYAKPTVWTYRDLDLVPPQEHTLLDALPKYVESKMKHLWRHLGTCLEDKIPIRVVGVLKEDFPEWCSMHGYKEEKRYDQRSEERRQKVVPLVTGRRDYIRHVAQLALAALYRICDEEKLDKSTANDLLQVYVYERACDMVMERMGLQETIGSSAKHAFVVLGYSEFFCSYFDTTPEWETVGNDALFAPEVTAFFGCATRRNAKTGVQVVFLSVRHTFWGDVAYYLVRKLCDLGVRGILYGAKLGTLSSPADIDKIVCVPTSFAYVKNRAAIPIDVKSCLEDTVISGPGVLHTVRHVSIRTIFDETRMVVDSFRANGAFDTIDDEVGQMARAVQGSCVAFGCIMYPTDYLHVWQTSIVSQRNMLNTNPDAVKRLMSRQAEEMLRYFTEKTDIRSTDDPHHLKRVKRSTIQTNSIELSFEGHCDWIRDVKAQLERDTHLVVNLEIRPVSNLGFPWFCHGSGTVSRQALREMIERDGRTWNGKIVAGQQILLHPPTSEELFARRSVPDP